ncbi:MAG: hypothetical protein AAF756_02270 [Pseudomonadota bacterium]
MNYAEELPPGFVEIGGSAVHVSELRKHTSDLRRFLEYLPATVQLEDLQPESEEAQAIYAQAEDINLLTLTLAEHGAMLIAMIKKMAGHREATP